MRTAAEARPVRVTIEGTAHKLSNCEGVLLVRREDGVGVCVPEVAPGITVEYLQPARTWRDGDVVQDIEDDRVWRRLTPETGPLTWTNGFMTQRTDARVDALLVGGRVRVLRYQDGEQ